MRSQSIAFCLGLFVALVPLVINADDTDIYIGRVPPPNSEPLVMFSLDYRPNLTAPASAAAEAFFRDPARGNMAADVDQLEAISTAAGGDGNMNYFDVLILTLKLVLNEISGVKVGLMINHNDAGSVSSTPAPAAKCKGAYSNAVCPPGEHTDNKDCDGDGIRNIDDFCPQTSNANNLDSDGDLCGNVCDNCPAAGVANQNANQADADGDLIGDVCDSTPNGSSGSGPTVTPTFSNGGVMLMGFQSLSATTRTNFHNKLIALKRLKPLSNSPDHPYQGAELFYEFFRYLTGQAIYNGHNGAIDFEQGTSVDATTNMRCTSTDTATVGNIRQACWDSAIELSANYVSPLAGITGCTKIFTINLMFQVSQSENDSTIFTTTKANGGLGITAPSSQNDFFPTVVDFLHDADLADGTFGTAGTLAGKQSVTSYFIVDPSKINNTTIAYAAAGGTNTPLPLAQDPEELITTLRNVFRQILSVSTTFVAASVPVNVFNRSQVVDNVYTALFQSDDGGRPFWTGNVKKLKLSPFTIGCAAGDTSCTPRRALRLIDSQSADAVDNDGRIKPAALTFWSRITDPLMNLGDTNSDGAGDTTDSSSPEDGIGEDMTAPYVGPAANPEGVVTERDGRYVARGGIGQNLPGFTGSGSPGLLNSTSGARQMFYYSGSSYTSTSFAAPTTLDALNANTTTATALRTKLAAQGADATAQDADALKILKFIRGFDSYASDGDADNTDTDKRFWMVGDPLHSRPLPINYGLNGSHTTTDNPAIYLAVASNDGLLRFIKNTDGGAYSASLESGKEMWAFMPEESMDIQRTLAVNATTTDASHPYGFDGAPSVFIKDVGTVGTIESGDRVILYLGMRRGGRAYYALDVTDPATPKFLWKIDNNRTGFSELGFSFSQPRVGTVQVPDGSDSGTEPDKKTALFFAGGYDTNKDYTATDKSNFRTKTTTTGSVNGNDTFGNAIFVVDAETGDLLWKAVLGGATPGPHSTDVKIYNHPELKNSIPSNMTVLDTDGDGLTDRILVADTGGNIWRADLVPNDTDSPENNQITDDWKLTLLARIGRHAIGNTGSNKLNDRRFFHEPDVVQSDDDNGPFDAVIIGSGDREDPLDYGRKIDCTSGCGTSTPVYTDEKAQNWFYVIKDRNVGVNAANDMVNPPTDKTLDNTKILEHSELTDITSQCLSTTCTADVSNGWRLQLRLGSGEKALASALTLAGKIFFTTYLPKDSNDAATCGPSEGGGAIYAVSLKTGRAANNYNTTDGGTAAEPNSESDRSEVLKSYGIPAQGVFISLPDTGTGGGGKDITCVLRPDLSCEQTSFKGRYRIFWQRVEEKP